MTLTFYHVANFIIWEGIMIIKDACEQFLLYSRCTKDLSPHTIKAYERDLDTFLTITGRNTPINEYDRNTLREYVNVLFEEGLSKATVKRRLACLKTMFKWLENEEQVDVTPFYRLDLKIRLPQRLPRNLSTQEIRKVLNAVKSMLSLPKEIEYTLAEFGEITKRDMNNVTTLISLEILFTTGLRVSELVGINLDDIYLKERYIHIRGKGQRERRVFITDVGIQNLIKTYIQLRQITYPNHNVLLVNSRGRPATTQTVRIWIKQLSEKAKLSRRATPHMYRHSTATHLLGAGVDISYVQKLLGHQSISTTQIYTHINNKELYRNVVKANIRGRVL
jgi:integrase/recombinase XerD